MPAYIFFALILFGELLIFDLLGALLPVSWNVSRRSTAEQVCAGFLIYTGLLEVLGFTATLTEMPLTTFCYIWAAVLCLLSSFSLMFRSKRFFEGISYGIRKIGFPPATMIAVFFGVLFLILVIILPSAADPGLVIGQMTQDLFHNSISLYEPGSGSKIVAILPEDLLRRYYLSDLFWCKIGGIHPMIMMRLIRSALIAIVSSMAAYRIFMRLFDENRALAGGALTAFLVLSVFFQRAATPSGLVLMAGWTGNAAFASCLIPTVLLLLLALYEEPENIRLHILLFFAGLSAISFSPQAVFIFPLFLAAGIIPIAVRAKDLLYIFRIILWIVVPVTALVLCLILPVIPMA